MIRGSTPTHTFNIKLDTSRIKALKITYSQNDKVVLAKYKKDCTIAEGKIILTLSQEDTFLFDADKYVFIRIRVLDIDGKCVPSKKMMIAVEDCEDDEVLI